MVELQSQDFIRDYVRKEGAAYVDLGNYDCGASSERVYVRDKLANQVEDLDRSGLEYSAETRIHHAYYLATAGLFVMAFYFSVFFMRDALGDDIWLLAISGLYVLPFLMRRFTSGFRIVVYYFAICTVFSLLVGSWKENDLGSGVLIFYVVGITPYIASRIFKRIWTEARVVISSGGDQITLNFPASQLGRLSEILDPSNRASGRTPNT